jgi:hypothetical protein
MSVVLTTNIHLKRVKTTEIPVKIGGIWPKYLVWKIRSGCKAQTFVGAMYHIIQFTIGELPVY